MGPPEESRIESLGRGSVDFTVSGSHQLIAKHQIHLSILDCRTHQAPYCTRKQPVIVVNQNKPLPRSGFYQLLDVARLAKRGSVEEMNYLYGRTSRQGVDNYSTIFMVGVVTYNNF